MGTERSLAGVGGKFDPRNRLHPRSSNARDRGRPQSNGLNGLPLRCGPPAGGDFLSPGLLQASNTESVELGIGAEYGQVVLDCLRGDHPIERVGMRLLKARGTHH